MPPLMYQYTVQPIEALDAATMSKMISRDGNDLLDQHSQPDPDNTGANHP